MYARNSLSNGLITREELNDLDEKFAKSGYGEYLKSIKK